MADQIQLRNDTLANWVSVNPVLAEGEVAVVLDTLKMKVGDGVTAFNSLSYFPYRDSVVPPIYQATLDFGASSGQDFNASVDVADVAITGTSKILCSVACEATADHGLDEVMIAGLAVTAGNVRAGVGFTIYGYCAAGTHGRYTINYTIQY